MHRIYFIFILSFFLSLKGSGQYLFNNITPKDGLSTREVRTIYQDQEGFMWMGTMNGLNRFDGNHVLVFNQYTPTYPSSLGEIITCITESTPGKIWFGTNSGAAILDKGSKVFSEVTIQSADNKPTRPNITQVQRDKLGRLWMATLTGIYIQVDNLFKPVSTVYSFAGKLDSTRTYHGGFLYDSVRNVFWAATDKGLFCLDLNQKQLFSEQNNPENLPVYNNHRLNAISVDLKGDLWMGSVTEHALIHYSFKDRSLEKIFRINNNPDWELVNGCNNLFSDRNGRLWISTWLFTSFVRLPDGRFDYVPYDKDLPYSIGYGLAHDVLQDSYGNIWFATINGVSKLSASGFVENIIKTPNYPFFFPINFSNANTISPDGDETYWIGKMEGLVKYDVRNKKFELYAPYEHTDRSNELFVVKKFGDEVWCGARNGVQIFNPITKTFRLLEFPNKVNVPFRSTRYLLQDRQKNVWIGTWDCGVYRYNNETKKTIAFDGSNESTGVFKPNFSLSILETSEGKIWISNANNGVMIYDPSNNSFASPNDSLLQNESVFSMAQDQQQNIWVSTATHGILKYDAGGKLLDSITRLHGLPAARYENIVIDKSGRLWTKSQEWLLCIQPASKQITKVNIDVTYSFNNHWIGLTMQDDRIYATMLDNIVIIRPEKFQRNADRLPPLIAGFRVFEEDRPVDTKKNIELSWKQNFFSIDFSSPFHREDGTIQYAYKLDGFNKDWVYCGRRQTADYTNVPYGTYRFLVKTTDETGQWNTQERVLTIHIKPPFWNTIWFRLLIGAIAIAILWWLYKLAQRRRRRINIENTIDYFANSVYGENSVNEICWDIARNCISQLQFEDCVVYLLDRNTNRLVQKAAYGPKNPKGHEIANPIEIEPGKGIVGTVALTGKHLLINDTRKDIRYIVDDEERLSELAAPILHDGKVIGVIDSEHSRKDFFTDEHVKALNTIASISANKIAEAQAEAQAKENEIKLLEINKLLAESQLMALRAQMNPHFVFNCLNSIQECIVTGKYGEASDYLNKFSKLFRTVLNNSGKNLVTMNEEKQVLELYLDLEHMRFEKSFSYKMLVDEDLESDEMLIPSMLLQPYVENALWHGLMHKEGERTLLIEFLKINEDVFRCVIDDNGIGREKSYELKAKQSKAKRHESKGLKISSDRLSILQKQGFHASLEIIDKKDNDGNAAGTTVIIELSTFLKN